jgi:hypothetical protein
MKILFTTQGPTQIIISQKSCVFVLYKALSQKNIYRIHNFHANVGKQMSKMAPKNATSDTIFLQKFLLYLCWPKADG